MVELPVQRRLYPIFVRDVGSTDIHKCFSGLTGSQRTPRYYGKKLSTIQKRIDLLSSLHKREADHTKERYEIPDQDYSCFKL